MHSASKPRWLSRTVVGIGIASFFADLGHETATAILPMFLASIGAAPAVLGLIEGVSDALSSFSKLGAGWYSDRLRKRKPLAVAGYFVTGVTTALFGFAANWFHVLLGRSAGWVGRGVRGPVRDAIMSEAVPSEASGRAFGFDRALDTLGAVLGPVAALLLIAAVPLRTIFFLTFIPGMLATIAFGLLVREARRQPLIVRPFLLSLKQLPSDFRRYLMAVAVFGMGDFAHTLLILRASQIFTEASIADASQLAVSLFVVHNVVYAGASYPVGALGDRIGKRKLLVIGYLLSGVMALGFLYQTSSYGFLLGLFAIGGLYVAIEDSLERAIASDLLPAEVRGTGFGVLATVNGVGDFISSAVVGFLWTVVSPAAGFLYAAVLSFAGAGVLARLGRNSGG